MVTEIFLNNCFTVLLNKNIKKDIVKDIKQILYFYFENKNIDIPITVKTKVDCLKTICSLKEENKSIDNIIDSISFSKKYEDFLDFLNTVKNVNLTEEEIEDNIEQIKLRSKLVSLLPHYDKLDNFIDAFKIGNFDSLDKAIKDYEILSKEMYLDVSKSKRSEDVEKCSSLNLTEDSYESVVEQIKLKYDRSNTEPTGFKVFDDKVLNGGFAKSRLYIFGGGSGSGKSTLILNCFANQISGKTIKGEIIKVLKEREKDNKENKKEVYIYITCENQVDETLLRLAQYFGGKTEIGILREVKTAEDLSKDIKKNIRKNVIPVIKYFPKYSLSCLDIRNIVDEYESLYGKGCVKMLYVDYLDILYSDFKTDLLRLSLSHITSELKDISIDYNFPIATPTQLNKSAYGSSESKDFKLNMITESSDKVNHSDFIAIMMRDSTDLNLLHMRIGKNRSGMSEISIDFKVEFKYFRVLNGYVLSSENVDEKIENPNKPKSFNVYDL